MGRVITPRRIAIFDIDGTIADCAHRQHYVQREKGKRDWKSFTDAVEEDAPKLPIIKLAQLLWANNEHDVYLFSGRSDRVKVKTLHWLKGNQVPYHQLHMRKDGDHRDDRVVKQEMLMEVVGSDYLERVDFVFDDRNKVVDMWRELGLTCLQVAPGDF